MSKKKVESKTEKKAKEKQVVKITQAKGRPMLSWVGKHPLTQIIAFPYQHIETFDPIRTGHIFRNRLVHGENKEVLATLLANGYRGKVNLIYIDPPFDSGADYVRKVALRGAKGAAKIEGETYSLGEQIQYSDIWANDNYMQFMYERVLLLKELLSEEGSIYLHCDYRKSHNLRNIMDEVFGPEKLRNEIIWFYPRGGDSEKQFNRKHDTILFYSKGDTWTFNYKDVIIPYTEEQIERFDQEDKNGKYYWNINPRGESCKTYYKDGIGEYDVWNIGINASQIKEIGYPTLKPEALLERIIKASSKAGDIVLDCFIGSGTTAAVAQKLGRRWVGCDINNGAIQTTSRRLQQIILEQVEQVQKKQPELFSTYEGETDFIGPFNNINPKMGALAYSVFRVNDYDLQIQHNEAVNLACEHIGIQRTKSDSFFDGTLGKTLVKIVPFNHPLTPLDLEEIRKELEARPDEARNLTVVCLGMELSAKAWVEDWNRLRKGKNTVNRIEIIELRTDPKYGKFIEHKPAEAKVLFIRKKDKVIIEIDDFISPTIIERLSQQAGVLKPKIDDWRAMVDCVMIDSNYNGEVFNIVISDVPEKKTDLVSGKYELQDIPANAVIALKIIDMLGEEVLVTKKI
jgi:DNA modification methylase